jgi:type II secretory pathway pseudopilin PulG
MRTLIPVRKSDRAFTLIELLVIVLVLCLILAALLPSLARPRVNSRPLKDSTQIRGIHQGMVLWAQNNQDRYPIPSDIDKDNATIKLADGKDPESKNTTANIISIMIYNGYFSPELCVSPAEANADIRSYDGYQYSNPSAAANPTKALWDPAFVADFTTKGKVGGFSYAHGMPHGERLKDWSNTFGATEAILGNRGPEIASVAKKTNPKSAPTRLGSGTPGEVAINMKIKNSNTLVIHGGRTTWEGNIAYNDNHVNFETSMTPDNVEYHDGKNAWKDCLFFDEPDDVTPNRPGRNAFLGSFVKAGAKAGDWKTIWD